MKKIAAFVGGMLACAAVALLVVGWSMGGGALTFNSATFSTSGSLNIPTGQSVTINSVDALTRLRHMWLDSGAFVPQTTSGAGTSTYEFADYYTMNDQIDFSATETEFAQVRFTLPPEWNSGPIKAKVYWRTLWTAESGVAWGLQAHAVSNADTIDLEWAETTICTDVNGTEKTLNITAAATVTFDTPIVKNDALYLRIYREVTNAADVIESDVSLLGVLIQYGESPVVSETW